jgi:hypothetical protein
MFPPADRPADRHGTNHAVNGIMRQKSYAWPGWCGNPNGVELSLWTSEKKGSQQNKLWFLFLVFQSAAHSPVLVSQKWNVTRVSLPCPAYQAN